MAYNHYGQFGDDSDRRDYDYDRDRNRARSSRDDEPGFFERAGEEIRSWFSDDDDRDRDRSREYRADRDRSFRERNTNRYGETGAHNMGRGYEPEQYRSDMSRDRYRSSSSDMGRGGRDWDDRYSDRSGMSRYGNSDSDRFGSSNRSPYGSSSSRYGSDRAGSEYGSQSGRDRQYGSQSSRYGSQSGRSGSNMRDDDSGLLIYEEFSGTLGGFGNQRFGSSQDDHYRNWRDREMARLDQDYQDYCRECEQQFASDFDTWRSQKQGQQSQSQMSSSRPSGSSSSSKTLTGQSGSAPSSAIGSSQSNSASSTQGKDTESASSGSTSRSGNRSRS